MVIFPAFTLGGNLLTEARGRQQLAQGDYETALRPGVEPTFTTSQRDDCQLVAKPLRRHASLDYYVDRRKLRY